MLNTERFRRKCLVHPFSGQHGKIKKKITWAAKPGSSLVGHGGSSYIFDQVRPCTGPTPMDRLSDSREPEGIPFYHLLSAPLKLYNESARPANQFVSPSLLRVTGHIQWQRQASKTNLFTISSLRHWTYPETAPGQQQTLSCSPLRVFGRIQRQRQASKCPVGAPNLFTVSSSEQFSPPLSRHQTLSPSPRRSHFHLPCRGTKPYHHLLVGAIFTSPVEAPNLITISSLELFSPLLSRHQTLSPFPHRSYFHVPCRDAKPYHHLPSGPGQGPRMELEEIWKRFAF